MKRIGILGGTFNPVHIGHLTIAEMVREQLKLDTVLFIPSSTPPHKSRKGVVSAKDRVHMLRLAIKGNTRFKLSTYEVSKGGKSYSIDTIAYLQKRYPRRTKIYFIIGSDLLPKLHTWKKFEQLKKKVAFIAVDRPDYRRKKSKAKVKEISTPGLQTSSSYLRQRLIAGKTIRYMVPDSVMKYIKKRKLYRN